MMAKLPSRLATRTELAAAPMAWLMAVAAMLLDTRTPAHSTIQNLMSAAYAQLCRILSDEFHLLSPCADMSSPSKIAAVPWKPPFASAMHALLTGSWMNDRQLMHTASQAPAMSPDFELKVQ